MAQDNINRSSITESHGHSQPQCRGNAAVWHYQPPHKKAPQKSLCLAFPGIQFRIGYCKRVPGTYSRLLLYVSVEHTLLEHET